MAVNKVVMNTENGAETLIDLTEDTVTAETLAEGATAHDASGQKITGKMAPGGGSSVQTDWNQKDSSAADFLKNKPFGDMPTGGDTLYWDGNTEGLVNVDGMLHKVSNAVPTKADFANGCICQFTQIGGDGVNDLALTAEEAQAMFLDDGAAYLQGVTIIPFDNYEVDGLLFREAGVYLAADDSMYVSFLTIPGYTGFPVTKKMDEKYLPGAVILYADDALTYLYNSSDITNTENRMTLAKLKELVLSGIPIQVLYSGFIYCMATNFVDAGDMGGFGMLSILMEGASTALYTAEYVPEE